MDTLETVRNFESCNSYFDAVHTGNKIYATNNSKKSVTIMTSDCFNTVGEFKMRDYLAPFRISTGKGFLFVACDSAILKYSLEGEYIQKYHAELRSRYITVTEDEQIVYCNTTKDSVTCIKKTGQIQWEYKHSRLKSPHSVDRDELDNLFVSGTDSNNIHILSSNGTLIKIIEDIQRPAFLKLCKDIDMCFV